MDKKLKAIDLCQNKHCNSNYIAKQLGVGSSQLVDIWIDQLASKVPQLIKKIQLQQDIDEHKLNLKIKIDLSKINVSGRQRQKIVLARASIHKSSILLIDEGTSAINV